MLGLRNGAVLIVPALTGGTKPILVTTLADRSLPGAMDAKMRRMPCTERAQSNERSGGLAGIAASTVGREKTV